MEQNNSSEMTDINPTSLTQRLDALSLKIQKLQEQITFLMSEKSFMEHKISDAQGRIQKILNKLPQTPDTRQLTLLDNSSEAPHE
jgi:predicted  nucleic acid-binding Zn-ribbon protein